jgi:ketosteroid isomerase-like protein
MKNLLLLCSMLFVASVSMANDSPSSTVKNEQAAPDLYTEILNVDTRFFDAFNRRDLDTMMSLFAKDLEFYHDKGGLTNYEKNLESTKAMFANNKTLRRELVRETMQVYPIKDYGALQIAEHRFCSLNNGKQDCRVFKFTHIWRKLGDGWQLARVISYDH